MKDDIWVVALFVFFFFLLFLCYYESKEITTEQYQKIKLFEEQHHGLIPIINNYLQKGYITVYEFDHLFNNYQLIELKESLKQVK